jgi:glutamate-1-semialdehyde 2,1-aminomutase
MYSIANALSLRAMRVTLKEIITREAFDKMMPLAIRFEEGVKGIIEKYKLPWNVTRLGVRVEYHFTPQNPTNGGEYEANRDNRLGYLMHIMALNRGILLTPFHNMALMSPYVTEKDVDYHTKVFEECVREILSNLKGSKL